ncbi:MAG TPA: EF-hand domain-containing protein [Ramlibacter sp.]|nr:EF-hand domain-containing protein [Ramlibacter sp.]
MNTRHSCALACAAFALAALLASPPVLAQARRITATPQPVRQAAPPGVATFGSPSPSGLSPPMPASLSPGVAPGSPVTDAGVQQPLAPAGGGGGVVVVQQATTGTNGMGAGPSPRSVYSAVDIARAFLDADTNHDGLLSRAEAQRLSIPLGALFDDLDRDKDGMLSRFEYEDAFR